MQSLKFVRALQNITKELKSKELVEFLEPFVNPTSTNVAVSQGHKDEFATLLFASRVGFTELSKDSDASKIIASLKIDAVYDPSRLFKLIALLNAVPSTQVVVGNAELFSAFYSFYKSLSSIVDFAAVSSELLEQERVRVPNDGDEILEVSVLDYDETGVRAERVEATVSGLIALHTHFARILGFKDATLKIAYVDSGSDIILGLATTAVIIRALRTLFNEYWEKVKYQRYAELDRTLESAEKVLSFNAKLQEQVAAKVLDQDAANILQERILSEMAKLIGNGTSLPLETIPELVDQRKLLTDKRDTKLLGAGDTPTKQTQSASTESEGE